VPLKKKKVIVLGGGLAGLAAAVPLAEEGFQVTVLERRPFLGGRAASYPIPKANHHATDYPSPDAGPPTSEALGDLQASSRLETSPPYADREFVDNCQHVLLRCCTNLLNFYRRLNVEHHIAFYDHYLFLDERGRQAVLRGSRLPAPLHLLPSFLRFTPLGWKDKLRVAYAFFCMLRQQDFLQELDRITMLQWLQQHGQSSGAIERFWRVVLVSALNEEIDVASARYGMKVFLDGMLRNRTAFHMGVPSVPLSRLYTEPSVRFLNALGGSVQLRSSAAQIEIEVGRVQSILLANEARVAGDYYVSTLPPEGLLKLLPEQHVRTGSDFASLHEFECSPITAIYLWFDREVTQLSHAALLGKDIQWIFNKKTAEREGRNYIGLVVSASRKLLSLSRSEILEIALRDLKGVLPSVSSASLQGSVVIKEPFATFSCRAGCDAFRPDQKTSLSNLFMAGDWTNTGWPPTMEGAVRSGYRCAELILEAEGRKVSILQPDLAQERLPRWISRW
jgi:squalene-associated FAD-dependent desaturase